MTTHKISCWETWKKLCDSVRFMFVNEIDPYKEIEFGIDLGGGNSEDFEYTGDMPEEEPMKALSLRQPYASFVAMGKKTIETRTWSTKYRGPLLIVSSKKPIGKDVPYYGLLNIGLRFGMALATAELIDCRPMKKEDEGKAMYPCSPGRYAWILSDIKKIESFPVKGQLRLFEVDYKPIQPSGEEE